MTFSLHIIFTSFMKFLFISDLDTKLEIRKDGNYFIKLIFSNDNQYQYFRNMLDWNISHFWGPMHVSNKDSRIFHVVFSYWQVPLGTWGKWKDIGYVYIVYCLLPHFMFCFFNSYLQKISLFTRLFSSSLLL